MPIISVIVPVYKVEPYLHRCVDSILAQSFQDFELILVDDGSPDRCGEICDEYAAQDGRIRVIHKENGGLSSARNAGIDWVFANSDSQWLSFIDSDDWVHPQYLKLLYQAVSETDAGASVCLYTRVTTSGEQLDQLTFPLDKEVLSFDLYFSVNGWGLTPYIACAKLYPKSCFSAIRFPIGKLNEDLFTTYQLLYLCGTIARVNSTLYYYFQSDNSIMRNRWSPKRLDEIEASEQLITFMHQKGCIEAERTSNKRLLWVLQTQLAQIRNTSSKEYSAYQRLLTKKARRLLLRGRKQYFRYSEYKRAYRQFFPLLSRFHSICDRFLKRIRKMVKRDG